MCPSEYIHHIVTLRHSTLPTPALNTSLMNNLIVTQQLSLMGSYEGWNFNSGNYLLTTDTK